MQPPPSAPIPLWVGGSSDKALERAVNLCDGWHGSRLTAEAAEYSGVNVRLIVGAVMVISAMCSGVAGMIGVAYFGSAQQNEFDTYLLDSIAAVVVGGTSLFGGRGGVGNTIVGLFVLGVLNNGLDHIRIDSFLKILIRGLILLLALIVNVYAQKMRNKAASAATAG